MTKYASLTLLPTTGMDTPACAIASSGAKYLAISGHKMTKKIKSIKKVGQKRMMITMITMITYNDNASLPCVSFSQL